jgi:hypothetical protein
VTPRNRRIIRALLALSAPLLILLALIGIVSRQGIQRVQGLPALLIGSGLLVSSSLRRRRRRRVVRECLRDVQAMPPSP